MWVRVNSTTIRGKDSSLRKRHPLSPLPPDISQLSFEQALAELEKIVRRLEEANLPLEDSILAYERGEQLKRHCDRLLAVAEQRIEKIILNPEGQVTGTEPLDPPESVS